MAGQFDIQFANQLPGVISMPRANLNVDTGADMLGQAFAHLGESAFGVAMGMKKTEQALKLSNMKRKLDETNNDEMAELETAFDDESQRKISEKYDKERSSIQSDDAEVSNQFTLHANEVMPYFNRGKSQRIVANKQKELTANFEANGNKMLGSGDVAGYESLVNSMDFIPPAEKATLIKNAPVEMEFAQAFQQLKSNPEAAEQRLTNKDFIAKLSPDQYQKNEHLLSIARKQMKSDIEDYSQKYWQLLQKDDFDSLKENLADPNNPLPVAGDGGKNWWMNLAQKREEDLNQTDPAMQSKISDTVIFEPNTITPQDIRNRAGLGIHGGLSLDKVKEYEEKYQMVLDKNSALNTPLAKTMFNELKNAQQDRAFSIDKDQNDVRYGQSLDSLTDYFVNYRKKNGKDPTLVEAQEYYQNLTSGYRSPERPFTEAKVQQTLGELASGGAVSIFGTVMPFGKPEDAINHVLRNLGPNWQKVAPEAATIIKEKWPKANIETKQTLPAKQGFEKGERRRAPNGGLYEYTGFPDDKAWKLVKE